MSLKKADWKAVLDQPKNAGLKAFGGTGISQALEDYAEAEAEFKKSQTPATATDRTRALKKIVDTCDQVIKKHKALYTTACNYLATVKQEAAQHLATATREREEIVERERLKNVARGAVEMVKETCAHTRHAITEAAQMTAIQTAWKNFSDRLEFAAEHQPKLNTIAATVKGFHKQPAPNTGVGSVKAAYLEQIQQVEKAVRNL